MPKSDFEFYQGGGNLPELVIPAPASDPYCGEFKLLSDVASLAVDHKTLGKLFEEEGWKTTVTAGNEQNGSCHNDVLLANDIKRLVSSTNPDHTQQSFVTVEAVLPDDIQEEQVMKKIYEIYDGVMHGNLPVGFKSIERLLEELPEEVRSNATYTRLPSGKLYDHSYLTGTVNPNLTFAEGLSQKVFEWLPGPDRESSTGEMLPPTFSPRPATILSVCSVKVELINPTTELKAL